MCIYSCCIFPRIIGILSYILSSEVIHYFHEIFNVTPGVPNATEGCFFWVANGEIHATCLPFNLPDNS